MDPPDNPEFASSRPNRLTHRLSSASQQEASRRKGRTLDAGSNNLNVERADVSVPPSRRATLERHNSRSDVSTQSPSVTPTSYPASLVTASYRVGSGPPSTYSDFQGDSVREKPTTATSPVLVTTAGVRDDSVTGCRGNNFDWPRRNDGPAIMAPTSQSLSTSPSRQPQPRDQSLPRSNLGQLSTSSRRVSGVYAPGSASPASDRSGQISRESNDAEGRRPPLGVLGICALDSKARSRPCRNILGRINAQKEFEVVIFGDKIILDEAPENWPLCDYLISFFSEGFPLDKAIAYTRLRKPFTVNDLPMQKILWDRRLCLMILDRFEVPTPKRVEVNRDGGPRLQTADMAKHVRDRTGVRLPGPPDGTGGGFMPPKTVEMLDEDTLCVDGAILRKPFVEKPVNGEDHNIHIYFPSDVGGGGRRLFRKINNKSSEADDTLNVPRCITDRDSSYIYEAFMNTKNHEDVKAYTVGPDYCHAETRKSPVVDGIVKRNTHGKEVRYVTSLNPEEAKIAAKVSEAFGQRVCGFDLLRAGEKSYVIDVNGWSFVKDNHDYYEKCASILREMFIQERKAKDLRFKLMEADNSSEPNIKPSESGTHLPSALKAVLRSPASLSRLVANHSGHRTSKSSFDGTLPMNSPPSMERGPSLQKTASSQTDLLPPPAHPMPTVSSAQQANEAAEGEASVPPPATRAQWKLKGQVMVIRHADRTPKQKFKFTFHSKPFVDLLKGHQEEVLLIGEAALHSVMEAVETASKEQLEDPDKLKLLKTSLMRKGGWPGTKVQIKPMFRSKAKEAKKEKERKNSIVEGGDIAAGVRDDRLHLEEPSDSPSRGHSTAGMTLSRAAAAEDNLELEKLQLVMKWGGEPTHSARYQSQELGMNMRNDLLLINADALNDVEVFSSSERRVTTSAAIWTAAFMDQKEVPQDFLHIRKDLLDDSNAAKDEMDRVKKKLKGLLREGKKAPTHFAWPANMPEPFIVTKKVVELMTFHRQVLRENFAGIYGSAASSLAAAVKQPGNTTGSRTPPQQTVISKAEAIKNIQSRWCCNEGPELFKERWEKLFVEFCDSEKIDPSKISELHDTIKFDALHNRPFLEWVFTPTKKTFEEFYGAGASQKVNPNDSEEKLRRTAARSEENVSKSPGSESKPSEKSNIAHRMGFRKRADIDPNTLRATASDPSTESYFKLITSDGRSRLKADTRLEKLRELFMYSKILFDYVGPQEYGINDSEKLEIGLLTSLPLLRAIVADLEDVQASPQSKTRVYFTKESHIYTLLNCIVEGGIKTKIARNKIPELDYLSTICFELYESQNPTNDNESDTYNYSIRITVSPGCHTFEPLDVQLDSRHTIGFAQRRSLTAHHDWKEVIETLRDKFHTVKLPKSFVAVNLSEKLPQAFAMDGADGRKASMENSEKPFSTTIPGEEDDKVVEEEIESREKQDKQENDA